MSAVFVVGAGPAGLFAAQKIALAGHQVIIFNRDIKLGGLAEYGIYPVKHKMKDGLRKQFAKVMALPNVHYFGHAPVAENALIHLEDLRQFSPAAMVFAVGAQGTKRLNLPGEGARGVYSAKDFVYFYNQLPPFASRDFSTGKRVAVVGMGNVMVDIARWLLIDDHFHSAEEVIVIARRGPFEAKFDEKEFHYIDAHLDRADFEQELARVKERVAAVGQDVTKAGDIFTLLNKPAVDAKRPLLKFRFLSSPSAIHGGADGRIERLTITENLLVERNGSTAAKATDKTFELDVDTMIFAIGDVADPSVGLPYGQDGYLTDPNVPDPKHPSFEVYDPGNAKVVDGLYVVGWARRASDGLVGIARHDGEVGAGHVLSYLEKNPGKTLVTAEEIAGWLASRGVQAVDKNDMNLLIAAEHREAVTRGVEHFKFSDDRSMLRAIEGEKSASKAAVLG